MRCQEPLNELPGARLAVGPQVACRLATLAAIVGLTALTLAVPATASAATGALTYQSCISSNTNASSCAQIPGATAGGANSGLHGLNSVAVSPDGKSVYTAAYNSDTIARFDRDPATGALTYQGCISSNSNVTSCTLIPGATAGGANTGLYSLVSVAVSPDGKSVYTAAANGDAVARFDRNVATGALTYQSCISSNSSVGGCTPIAGAAAGGTNTGLDNLTAVTVSADGISVYASSSGGDAVARFTRDSAGALAYQGCISSNSSVGGCTPIPGAAAGGTNTGLDNLYAVVASADGKGLYTAGASGDAVARFDRDPATGALTYQGCISSNSTVTGCTLIPGAVAGGTNTGLDFLQAVAVSADGGSVYTAAYQGDAIARFDRNLTTGALTYQGCISSNSDVSGCTLIPGATAGAADTGLYGLDSVAVSADGKSVYTAAYNGDAIARFDRDPTTGALAYQGCISSNSDVGGCTSIPGAMSGGGENGLYGLAAVAVSPDGKSVYTAANAGDAIARLDREVPPAEPQPPAEPSNDFSFGKLKRNKNKGTAKLTVEVPGPGELVLAGKNLKRDTEEATAAGDVKLLVKAKGKAAKTLRDRGAKKVTPKVTYTPTGGAPNTEQKKLKLIRRR